MADIEGRQEDNNCHICYRDMDNFTPRKADIVKNTGIGRNLVSLKKGTGFCPEHGISYSALSVKPSQRGGCSCGKDDCPVCS